MVFFAVEYYGEVLFMKEKLGAVSGHSERVSAVALLCPSADHTAGRFHRSCYIRT